MNSLRLASNQIITNKSSSSSSSSTITAALSRRFISLNHSKVLINESKTPLIISAVGKDRVGLTKDMTKCVREVNGSIRGSPGIRLGNHFYSLTMLADVPKNQVPSLMNMLKLDQHLHATVYEASLNDPSGPFLNNYNNNNESNDHLQRQQQNVVGYSGKIVVEGADNPGIMHKITTLLQRNGLNIDHIMESSDEKIVTPMGGTHLFKKMVGIAHAYEPLSKGFNPRKVIRELSELGDSVNCDITMTEAYRDDEWVEVVEEVEDDDDFSDSSSSSDNAEAEGEEEIFYVGLAA